MTDPQPQPGSDLVFARAPLQERLRWASEIANAGDLVPKGFRDGNRPNAAKVLLAAETGAMLGIHPIAALNGIHVIEGKPTISAGLMSALVRRAGHKLRVTTSGSVKDQTFEATAILIRADDPDFQYRSTWNWDRAQRAGLTGKDTWKKYFEAMAKSRAISEVVREGAEDVLMGGVYTPEEFGADVNEAGEVIETAVVVEPDHATKWEPAPWEDRLALAKTVDDLRRVWIDANRAHVLDEALSNGEPLRDVILTTQRRMEDNAQQAAMALEREGDYDEAELV